MPENTGLGWGQNNQSFRPQYGGLPAQSPSELDEYIKGVDKYKTNIPSLQELMAMLQGNQGRDLGLAGRQGAASAAAYGLNPHSAIQRAQSPIYGQYAQQASQLPMQLSQLGLASNQADFQRILSLLQLKYGKKDDGGGGFLPGLFQLAGTAVMKYSDRRLKKNIYRIGHLPNGLNIYRFEYRAGGPTQVGVMADEVELIIPEAVLTRSDGYKMVNYSMLR